jgi:hypothetical protein
MVAWFCSLSLGLLSGPSIAAQAPEVRAAQAAIMQADREFNRAVADGSRERFAALIVPTAVFSGGTPDEARGKDAILNSWSPFFDPTGPKLPGNRRLPTSWSAPTSA